MDRAGAVQGVLEGRETSVIPERLEFLFGALNKGNVNMDVGGLPDAVEAADTLLEQARVAGEIEKDEMVGELEIAPFRPNL